MLKHIVLFRWKDGSTPDARSKVGTALSTLPGLIEQIRSYHLGQDAAIRPGNWDFGLVAEFDDRQGWETYVKHPEHIQVVEQFIIPVVEERASVQIEI
jgi:hypothetical protein